MFEALMPDLFVPEAQWGPDSWGVNHPLFVQGQIEHGSTRGRVRLLGISRRRAIPAGGYREYGVDMMGMDEPGYTSDQERTSVDPGFFTVAGTQCRPPQPPPEDYGDGVVTPHAVFLALPYATDEALENLANLRENFDAYGPGGFFDAVAVRSGTVATRYLSLDQAMIMAAIGNELRHDMVKEYFVDDEFREAPRPLMAMESFLAGPAGNTQP